MTKLFRMAAVAAVGAVLGTAALANPSGTWLSQKGEDTDARIKVKISACGSDYCGVISDVIGTNDRSNVGKTMIKGMSGSGNSYSGGQIWAPDTGKWYKSKMQLQSGGAKLKVSGCVAGGLICRSQIWTKQ